MPSKRVKKDNREDNDQQNSDLKKMRGPAFLGGGLFMPPPPPKAPNGNVQELPPQPSK